jgi:cytochrome c oxidase accessory protein FixG
MSKHENGESFRDHVAHQTKEGKREWIYPKIIKGKFYKYRSYFSWFLLAFFFIAPFVKIAGYPLLLLNVLERRFVIFGQPFWPQDFHVFVFLTLTLLVFIVLFTVVFGRVWCGWACPQTIFMEMVFRKIENLIEGNSIKQKKLDAMPWNGEKIYKKTLKHSVFYLISLLISHTFLAYIIGYEVLWAKITGPFSENYGTLLSLMVFSFIFYLVFAKMRELVCIMACPYGRLQGVMLDPNSMVVAYDHVRGEPRGKIRKNEEQGDKGDCVDCGLCVDVCPTGIDIRNGTQLECINCTICMDACDAVMDKIDKPIGLIRIDSKNNIEKKQGFKFTPRIIAYTAVMGILFFASFAILATRKSVEANVLRIAGSTYSESDDGRVTNMYNLELVNKTFEDKPFKVALNPGNSGKNAKLVLTDQDTILQSNSEEKKVIMITMERLDIDENDVPMQLDIYIDGKVIRAVETNFLAPVRQ